MKQDTLIFKRTENGDAPSVQFYNWLLFVLIARRNTRILLQSRRQAYQLLLLKNFILYIRPRVSLIFRRIHENRIRREILLILCEMK